MKMNPSLLIAAFFCVCTNASLAQGTLLYTWSIGIGAPRPGNVFQASFEINGSMPGTQAFEENATGFTLTSPDHTFTQVGGEISLTPFIIIASVSDSSFPGVAWLYPNSITEYGADGSLKFSESGYWTYSAVPEPSSAALVVPALLTLIRKKASSLP